MSKTLFSHDLRVLLCDQCGAAIDVALSGGIVQCRYCDATNHLVQRDERADLAEARAAAESTISESERLAVLRQQDGQPLMPPPSMMHLVAGDELATGMIEQASSEWQAMRRRLQSGAPFTEQEHLFHLTLLLTPHLDERRQRAFLETASEILEDARHRHMLRCLMAKRAVLAGDLASTEAWLALCNPKPTDLQMDSGYRLARCYLAIAGRRPQEVLELLGYRFDDVPIADGLDTEAAVLRAHAYEMSGDKPSATRLLQELLLSNPWHIAPADRTIAFGKALSLCPATYAAVRDPIWTRVDQKLRPPPGLFGMVGCVLVIFVLLGAAVFANFVPDWFANEKERVWLTIGCVVLLLAALATLNAKGRVRNLHKRGVLAFARFVPEEMVDVHSDNNTTRTCKGTLEISLGDSVFSESRSFVYDTMLRPGYYPCLFIPEKPDTARVLVVWG